MPPSDEFSLDRVAELARIEISDTEAAQLQQQIGNILSFINVLDELDLDQVEPFFGLDLTSDDSEFSPQREDIVKPSTPRDKILKNSPGDDDEFYQVPPVF